MARIRLAVAIFISTVMAFSHGPAQVAAQANKFRSRPTPSGQCDPARGEDLFRGLFFGVGRFAALSNVMTTPSERAAVQRTVSRMTPAQTIRLLERNRAQLLRQGRLQDAKFVGEALKRERRIESSPSFRTAPASGALDSRRRGELSAQIINRIQRQDPGYFPRLQRELTSGNPLLVQRAVKDAGLRVLEMSNLLAGRSSAPSADDKDPGHGVDQDSSLVLWLGIVIVLLAWVALPLQDLGLTSFSEEEAIAKLTRRLKC